MHWMVREWDGVELWLSRLPYVPQVAIMLTAVLAMALVIVLVLTVIIDRVGTAFESLAARRGPENLDA